MLEFLKTKKIECIVLLAVIILLVGLVFFRREGYDVTPEDEYKLNLLMKGGVVSEQDQAYVLSALKKLKNEDED